MIGQTADFVLLLQKKLESLTRTLCPVGQQFEMALGDLKVEIPAAVVTLHAFRTWPLNYLISYLVYIDSWFLAKNQDFLSWTLM